MRRLETIPRTGPGSRRAGIMLAFGTALVSGVAVFVNSYGVRRVPDASVYTTAKNLVAAFALLGLLASATALRSTEGFTRPRDRRGVLGLAVVGVIGGSVPFVLFFEGLARSTSPEAAFIHKTLVVWVALMAVPLLRERLGPLHWLAIGLLVVGQAELVGGLPSLRDARSGELMILAATLLWSVEVIVAKRLLGSLSSLTVGTARLALGSVVLLGWLAGTGRLGELFSLSASAWGWVLLTGLLLTAYVVTWFAALARAQAVDVTSVLVSAALVTALLDAAVRDVALAPQRTGLVLVALGAVAVAAAALRRRPVAPSTADATP